MAQLSHAYEPQKSSTQRKPPFSEVGPQPRGVFVVEEEPPDLPHDDDGALEQLVGGQLHDEMLRLAPGSKPTRILSELRRAGRRDRCRREGSPSASCRRRHPGSCGTGAAIVEPPVEAVRARRVGADAGIAASTELGPRHGRRSGAPSRPAPRPEALAPSERSESRVHGAVYPSSRPFSVSAAWEYLRAMTTVSAPVTAGVKAGTPLRTHRQMIAIRLFEDRVNDLYTRALMPGLAHLYIGEEGVAVGICEALRADDYITSTHRGHGHCLADGRGAASDVRGAAGQKGRLLQGQGRLDAHRGSRHREPQGERHCGGGAALATGAAFASRPSVEIVSRSASLARRAGPEACCMNR